MLDIGLYEKASKVSYLTTTETDCDNTDILAVGQELWLYAWCGRHLYLYHC